MIIPSKNKILIVPDLGTNVGTRDILALKNAFERHDDCDAWEWMTYMLGEDKEQTCHRGDKPGPLFSFKLNAEEIGMARDMAQRYNIKRGDRHSIGWFTADEMDTHMRGEHKQRFGTVAYPPGIGLDTDAGIACLATQIDKFLKSDEI